VRGSAYGGGPPAAVANGMVECSTMSPDAATLNVQPRQRRDVYESLAAVPEGSSVKDLLSRLDIPETELRETLRKLDAAGLARRLKGVWLAVPLDGAEAAEPPVAPEPDGAPEA
jgi:hypothetical protein